MNPTTYPLAFLLPLLTHVTFQKAVLSGFLRTYNVKSFQFDSLFRILLNQSYQSNIECRNVKFM